MRTNVIYCDDNLERMVMLPEESVDLIYLDPPFFSNRHYEVIWGDEGEVRSFEDRWEGGVEVYTQWMRERAIEMHRVLKDTGSIYLHCDWHASHYLKVMMDSIFEYKNFLNEIHWLYTKPSTSKAKHFPRASDTLLLYTKTKGLHVFNANNIRIPYSEKTKANYKKGLKGSGTLYDGLIRDDTGVLDKRGKIPPNWWKIAVSGRFPKGSSNNLGYPTQKPEALLERIIKASSRENDVVFDPFCGCGTALVVADKLNRKWVGIDISPTACNVMKNRLQGAGINNVTLLGMPATEDDLRKLAPFEFQNWVIIEGFNGKLTQRKSGDMGVDGLTFMMHEPIQVKQSDKVGRNVVDNFETAIERKKKDKGYIVAFSFTKGAYEEAARCKREKNLEIELVTVNDLLEKKK